MRIRASGLGMRPARDEWATWFTDVLELIAMAYGTKHVALFTHPTKEDLDDDEDEEAWLRIIRILDEFIMRSDQLEIESDFVFVAERWKTYIGPASEGDESS
jgi:hypothetical protein